MKKKIKKGYGVLLPVWAEVFVLECKNSDLIEVNASKVAANLKVSLPHLSRTYLKFRGYSFHEFICKEKIRRAQILLKRYPKIKITKIANDLGYSSVSYFARAFMKYNDKVTPECYKIISQLKREGKRRAETRESRKP